tara:strand:- start:1041 stop:1496 length:456 start_codon:yes stop_codon:yes gene_type:complete
MTDEDLIARYAIEAKDSITEEAEKRIAETVDTEHEVQLRSTPLISLLGTDDLVPALLSRLGAVRAALDGHGGGIKVDSYKLVNSSQNLDLILDLTGACLSCGAAPGTLEGVKNDLEKDAEINSVRFSTNLLDTFDELGREFILEHGNVEFV